MKTYKDTISGEKLYVAKNQYGTFYYKDKTRKTYHRIDGPAAVWENGTLWWYRNGKVHRVDGPAVLRPTAKEWYVDGIPITRIWDKDYAGPHILRRKMLEI